MSSPLQSIPQVPQKTERCLHQERGSPQRSLHRQPLLKSFYFLFQTLCLSHSAALLRARFCLLVKHHIKYLYFLKLMTRNLWTFASALLSVKFAGSSSKPKGIEGLLSPCPSQSPQHYSVKENFPSSLWALGINPKS